ncbi:adenosine kinase [Spirochaetota bacterium]
MKLKVKTDSKYDVVGIGSALLDFTVEVDDNFLSGAGLNKGEMYLIDIERSREIISTLKNYRMETTPGGSSANTVAGISTFNCKGIFLGKVGNDEHGNIYIKETENSGVSTRIGRDNTSTGHAITFITPDSERTFATHLGAALEYKKSDIIDEDIINSRILHMEGYLFEMPSLYEACLHGMKIARDNGVLISIDLSDPALISRIHHTFKNVLNEYTDIVFVNEEEAKAFTGKTREDALTELHKMCPFAVVKLGDDGSLIKYDGMEYKIDAYKTEAVNTNGAGDMYAAGVLYGIANNLGPEKCGKLGSYASSLVVSQVGARLSSKINPLDII